FAARGGRRWLLYDAIVLKVEIGRHIDRGRNPEVIIESMVEGAGMKRLGVIGSSAVSKAKMPFPYAGSVVAFRLEHGRNRHPSLFDEIGRLAPEHTLFQLGAP